MDVNDELENILTLLRSGEIASLDDLQSRLRSPAEKTLLKRASLLRAFDENIFNRLLRALPKNEREGVTFEEFTRNPELERVPRTEQVYCIRENVRQNHLQEWSRELSAKPPKTALKFLENLTSYYAKDETRYELDLLGVLILSDTERAREKFLELFGQADKNFDLARCHDILKTLEDRLALLNSESAGANELRALCIEKRQYLKARSLFSSEYYQTVFFHERAAVKREFDDLLKNPSRRSAKWIFHLYAPGGTGKTMFIRWLIARHFVPEPRKVPVARLDFDFLHLPIIESHPWLLILAIAEQLNQQIEGTPFNEHLKDYWHFLSLLRPPSETPGDDRRENNEKLIRNIKPAEAETIINRIIDALKEVYARKDASRNGGKPFVVVFDTLERMVLYYKPSLIAALRFLEKIHDHYRQMRLLLSGRYNLQDRLKKEFDARYKKHAIVHKLKLFSLNEAHRYLREKRNLHDKKVNQAIVKKCEEFRNDDAAKSGRAVRARGCNPFKLSLIADFYQQEIVKTPEEILSLERTDVEYLINRIITHIKEPTVQWLLRYAVVPRPGYFTFDIFEKVLAPRLEEELMNNGVLDDPNRNFPKGAEKYEAKENWQPLKPEDRHLLDRQTVWNNLRNYASSQSWISFDAGEDGAPQLHSDVIVPMRHLLQSQEKIFDQLHADCAAYFEKKAASEKDAKIWAQNICEVIYHHFQKDGAKAASLWRELLDSDKSQRNPGVRRMIAREITGGDYVNEETKMPLCRADKEYLVKPEDLCEAHLRAIEAAIASLAALRADQQADVWAHVHEHFTDLQRLAANNMRAGEEFKPPFTEQVLRLLTREMRRPTPNKQKLISLLLQAVETTASRQMLLSFEILLGDICLALNDEAAIGHYENALKIRESVRSDEVRTAEIRLKIASWHRKRGDFMIAERVYRNLLPVAEKENNLPVLKDALRNLAEINEEQGQYDECVGMLERIYRENTGTVEKASIQDEIFLSRVEARNLFQPLPALARLEEIIKTEPHYFDYAAINDLHGEILGKLMMFQRSRSELERSIELWTIASDPIKADRARKLRIELEIFGIGDYKKVASLFNTWKRTGTKTDLELTSHIQLLRVLFEYRCDNHQKARADWQKLLKEERSRNAPRNLIRVLAMGLALNFGDESTIGSLIAELQKIEPVSARLPLLEAFKYAEIPVAPAAADRRAIVGLIELKSRGRDIIPHALIRADLLGWCGETALAEKLLDEAANEALGQKNSLAFREILLAKDRLKAPLSARDDLFRSDFTEYFALYPNLCAAGCIEQAARFWRQENFAGCHESLVKAEEFLKKTDDAANQWKAKLDELFGDLARHEHDTSAARNRYNSALSIYKRLGNEPAADRLRLLLPQIKQREMSREQIYSVRMEATAKTLSVEYFSGEERKDRQKFASNDYFLPTVTAETGDDTSVYIFSKSYLSDPPGIEAEIGKLLFSEHIAARLAKPGKDKSLPDFRLEALTPSLAKMPWELAGFEKQNAALLFRNFYRSMSKAIGNIEQVRWLQIALRELLGINVQSDGVFGPQTQAGLKMLLSKLKLPEDVQTFELNTKIGEMLVEGKPKRRTKALLIVPRREHRIQSQRGMEFSGPSIDWWYEDCYFTVETLYASRLETLQKLMKSFQPDVVHIQSSFRLMQTFGQIYLDFSGEPDFASENIRPFSFEDDVYIQPSAAFLNDGLALLPETKVRPLVILDAICPPGSTEIIRQLLYRNAFAAELFQSGNASAVIAMGLCDSPKLQGEITPLLIPALSNTETFGSIVRSIRKLSTTESLEEKIPTLGVALYTNEPSLTVLSNEKI